MGRYIIGITGASGSIYANRLIEHLKNLGHEVQIVVTKMGDSVCKYERQTAQLALADIRYPSEDFFAPISSGTYPHDGMVVIPCSMGTLAKMATGVTDNLLTRAADVCLKERRPLIVVPREAPISLIHLENMRTLLQAGAVMIPASPHFYHHPKTIEDLIDNVLARVLDQLKVKHKISPQWGPE
jgi:flavin prenyltransferase